MSVDDQVNRAREILLEAIASHQPVKVFAAFSGGNDSIVATHFTLSVVPSAKVLHIDTGIGIPATREHVRSVAQRFDWDLLEARTPNSYEDLVLGKSPGYLGGFPGRGMHGVMYSRLKERALRRAVRWAKFGHHRQSRVLIVSGIRADESKRRMGYGRTESKVGSQVWVNPLYWASHADFEEYRQVHGLPRNPVKDRVGISGECLCGAYADPGELLMVELTCPRTGAYLRDLEGRVRAAGFPWGWEENPPKWWFRELEARGIQPPRSVDPELMPMCYSCEKVRILDEADSLEANHAG